MPFNVKTKCGFHTIRDPGDGSYKKVGPVDWVKFQSAPPPCGELEIVNLAISEPDSIPHACISAGTHLGCPLWIDAHKTLDSKSEGMALQAAERNKSKSKSKSKE